MIISPGTTKLSLLATFLSSDTTVSMMKAYHGQFRQLHKGDLSQDWFV